MEDYKSGFAAIKAHFKYPEEFQADLQQKMFPNEAKKTILQKKT